MALLESVALWDCRFILEILMVPEEVPADIMKGKVIHLLENWREITIFFIN